VGKASPAIAAFVGGEWAPQMEGRTDVEKYPVAAHIAQNMIALKQGPATFRQGTAYVQPVKNSANRSWLRRFEFSQSQAFILEFGDLYVRFYTLHGPLLTTGNPAYNAGNSYVLGNQVVSGGITYYCIASTTGNAPPNATYWYPMTPYQGSPTTAIYEIPSPFGVYGLTSPSGFFNLDIQQQGDVLYICGGSSQGGPVGNGYPPYTLTRFANAPPNWQFAPYAPTDGPFADALPLVPGSEIALTVSAIQGNGITISAWGGNVFAATDVGRLVRIGSQFFNVTPWATAVAFSAGASCVNNGNNYLALNSATTGASPPVHTAGAALDGPTGVRWLYTDSGYGVAQITAYSSPTSVTANVIKRFPANVLGGSDAITGITNANPAVVSAVNGIQAGSAVFIIGVVGMPQVNGTPYTNATTSGTTVTLAGVDSTSFGTYTSGGFVILNASTEWQLGAWSNTTEWPRALAFFKDRLFLAGKLHVWGSVPGLYTSHTPDFFGVQTTDSAMNELVSGSDASNICWLSSNIILLIGTEGGEYGLDSANYSSSPLGPANVEILPQSQWRCRDIHPEKIGTSLLYAQRAGRKILAADYNFYLNRYDSTDQNKFAYHITIGGLQGICYQQEPWSILWGWRADGTFLAYTFNREDQVTAWMRQNMGNAGMVESMAVIPAPDGLRDECWFIVNRTVNGAVIRTVEYMVKHYEGPQAGYAGDPQSSAWYVDCGVQYIAPPTITITFVSASFGLHGTTITFTGGNTLAAGRVIVVSGVVSTGSLNVNGTWTVLSATSSSFIVSQPGFGGGSFAYISGGTASGNSGGGTTSISGLPPVMWNQTVNILADGGAQPQQVVSATGTLTLQGTFNLVTVGFPYQGNVVPMRMEGGADTGTAQGKIKQGAALVLRLIDTYGATVSQLSNQTNGQYQDPLGLLQLTPVDPEFVMLNYTTTGLDSPPPIQSGDFPVSFPARTGSDSDERDMYILVQQSLPLPMTVAGLYPSYKVQENQ
jgi:hypothetical protein